MIGDREALQHGLDELEGPFNENFGEEEDLAEGLTPGDVESPFVELDTESSDSSIGESFEPDWTETLEEDADGEGESLSEEAAALESLLEAEAGAGTSIASRL